MDMLCPVVRRIDSSELQYDYIRMLLGWPIVQPIPQQVPPVPQVPAFTEQDVKELADM